MLNKHTITLFFASLFLNFMFLCVNYKNEYYLGLLAPHGEIAYNVYRFNSIKGNPERLSFVCKQQQELHRVFDYAEIDHDHYGPPTQYRSIQDTVGYGVLLGLLWKITGSLRYLDIQILQILIFSLLMFLFYSLAFMIFGNERTALLCSIAHLCFLPLFYLNVQACRDIWAYYGVLLMIWALVSYLFFNKSYGTLFMSAVAFALIQHIRPTILLPLCMAGVVIGGAGVFKKVSFLRVFKAFITFGMMNVLIFWLPFMAHNKMAYNRYFVMGSGQGLLEGLGEYPNKWGFQLNDGWVGEYIYAKYGITYGTQECDDVAKQEFLKAYYEDPGHFYRSIARRLPLVILPGLPWNNICNVPEDTMYDSLWAKVKVKIAICFSSARGLFDFLTRHIYIRLYLLLGYFGLALMLWSKKYIWVALIVVAVILPSWSCIQSHIEYRYLIPYYAFYSLFVGYGVVFFCHHIVSYKN